MRCHVEVKGIQVSPVLSDWDAAVAWGDDHLDDAEPWYVCPRKPLSNPLPVFMTIGPLLPVLCESEGTPW